MGRACVYKNKPEASRTQTDDWSENRPTQDSQSLSTTPAAVTTGTATSRNPSPEMEKTTPLAMMMMMAVMVGLVTAQLPWPPQPPSCINKLVNGTGDILVEYGPVLTRPYSVYCVDNFARYHQLWVTDEEAEAACEKVHAVESVKKGGALAPHPRTCFAYLRCSGYMLNPKTVNTVYRFTVGVNVLARGTYFVPNQVSSNSPTAAHWGINNLCEADPCKTNKAMPDALQCQTYWTCKRDANNNAVEFVENNCLANQSYSVMLNRCVNDDTCNPRTPSPTENVRCYKAPPVGQMIPGLTEQSYYNRTFRFLATNQEVTVQEICAAGLIFDPDNKDCTEKCICVLNEPDRCTTTTLIEVGEGTGRSWSQEINADQYVYEVEQSVGQFMNWVKFFPDQEFSYYEALGLEQTELAGNWNLTFSVAKDDGNLGDYVLCENTDNSTACPNPSLRIRVVGNSVRAEVVRRDGVNVNVVVDNVIFGTRQKVTVVLQREGDTLTLKINSPSSGQRQESQGGMGTGPLASTRCGLVFGNHFRGWLESVRLKVNQCTA